MQHEELVRIAERREDDFIQEKGQTATEAITNLHGIITKMWDWAYHG
jgi:hypothetical protein